MQNSADSGQSNPVAATPASFGTRALRMLRPSHQHTAYSATLLLMTAVMLSRVLGFAREQYIAWAFGATPITDAYNAGFTIPDWLNYLVAGGTASITFVSIYTRFLAQGRKDEAEKTFSVIVTVMTAVMTVGIILAEIFAPQLIGLMFRKFSPDQLALCIHLTRILLPAQLFFYVGGVVSAVLLSRKMFFLPAFGPMIYTAGIILGGLFFSHRIGIAALAYGAVVGSFLGVFLINAIGASRVGVGYRISFDIDNPAFREWVRMSIPLMLGVSLITADDWFLRYFAQGEIGDITRLNYAKRLIQVPIAILGQSAGQASLPFFARLFGEKKTREFSDSVNGSVFRISAAALLATSLIVSISVPLVDLLYRRGKFPFTDSQIVGNYLFWFSLSLVFWCSQSLYARAFYAAGNTLTPMIASSLVTLATIPVYAGLFKTYSTVGLVMASNLGIMTNCLAMALLLHRRKLVWLTQFQWLELGKAAITALIAGVLSHQIALAMMVNRSRVADMKVLALSGLTWTAAVAAGLWLTKSSLPSSLRRRKAVTYPLVAEKQAEELTKGVEP